MEGNPNKAMHVATLYLDIVGFSQGCPGYPEVPVCQYCECVCVCRGCGLCGTDRV